MEAKGYKRMIHVKKGVYDSNKCKKGDMFVPEDR